MRHKIKKKIKKGERDDRVKGQCGKLKRKRGM